MNLFEPSSHIKGAKEEIQEAVGRTNAKAMDLSPKTMKETDPFQYVDENSQFCLFMNDTSKISSFT